MSDDVTKLKVDVGILQTQVSTLTSLCQKMDKVIEKLVDQQDRYITQVYQDMENKRIEKNAEIKEIHDRIDTVIDKVQITELRIMDEIKELRSELLKHNQKEEEDFNTIKQWKWMILGGIVVLSWLFSNINFDILSKLLAH